ncbi:MAG: PAS domain S-box protein [Planctomycetes bacterium]|nr:PAS domain S-box protein [Planctomycetota bacterium]
MKARLSLVWKLSAVVAAILAVAIIFFGWGANRVAEHYSLESSREFLKFNSESIVAGIGQQMMSRNNEGIEDLIVEMSRGSEVYGDIRLVSHRPDHYGEIVASRFSREDRGREVDRLELEDGACSICHELSDFGGEKLKTVDRVIERADGDRLLSVTAPILNGPGCGTADCHLGDPRLLGFVNANYSLGRMDAMASERRTRIILMVVATLLAGIVALWSMFALLLERPIGRLVAGTKQIAANKLDFRFEHKRSDEIGVLEESFNAMTATIQAGRQELTSARDYLQGIVENSADIIITVDTQGLIETFNRGAEEALGYRREEVIGRRIETLFADPRERDVAIARLEDTDNVKNYETRFLAKDGQIRNVLLTLSRLRDPDGNACGTFGISKDVTAEKRLQRELVQAQKFAAIGQAMTGIQHAIKNMLGALTGGAYLVRVGVAKDNRDRIEEGRAMVEDGIDRIGALSRSMLNYAKQWKLELQTADLNEMVEKLCDANRQAAAEQGVDLRCELPQRLPHVACDPNLIYMATTDLLLNAVDACTSKDDIHGGGKVVLTNSLAEGGDCFVIEVRDNGCGMNEEVRRNIFVPFFSTKKTLGTGLGLALTARIVSVHDGELTVESEPDQGAVFRIHLPIHGPKDDREAFDGQTSSDH